MKKQINSYLFLIFACTLIFSSYVFAVDFSRDIYIKASDIKVTPNILQGQKIKIYTTVTNSSNYDLTGVVKFYDEKAGKYMGTDQPVSILAKKTDDVFIDWIASTPGSFKIAIRVDPWDREGDNPENNKVTKVIYVDIDTDKDGKGNQIDPDDDNDGVVDVQDDFPLNPDESKDTDKDGIGDNADTDDDNDGVVDTQDVFPTDKTETKDSDKDGVGNNADPFPYDSKEWKDSDKDGVGDNSDVDNNNKGPIPDISIDSEKIKVNKKITFSAIKSTDPDGKIISYEWDFGDNKKDTGTIVAHAFEKSGEYVVTLKTTDDKKESRTKQMKVKVGFSIVFIGIIILIIILILIILAYLFRDKILKNIPFGSKVSRK